jgi:hypothetical protein
MKMTTDTANRVYARLSELKVGDIVEVDDGFGCLSKGDQRQIKITVNGSLYIDCAIGQHTLIGQLDNAGFLIGIYKI